MVRLDLKLIVIPSLLALCVNGNANDPLSGGVLELYSSESPLQFERMKFDTTLSASLAPLGESRQDATELVFYMPQQSPKMLNGCNLEDHLNEYQEEIVKVAQNKKFVIALARGGCNFSIKAQTAKALHATALVVYNNEDNYFDKGVLSDPCAVDCSKSQSNDKITCEGNSGCHSNLCLSPSLNDQSTYCCAEDYLIAMILPSELDIDIPAVYTSTESGELMKSFLKETSLTAKLYQKRSSVLGSVESFTIMFTFTMLVISILSLNSAKKERQFMEDERDLMRELGHCDDDKKRTELLENYRKKLTEKGDERLSTTFKAINLDFESVILFFLGSCIGLFALYYVLSYVEHGLVVFIIYIFSLSAIEPLQAHFWTPFLKQKAFSNCLTCLKDRSDIYKVGYLASCLTIIFYLIMRHDSSLIWIIQDLMAICLLNQFLSQVKIDKLDICFKLLSLFFIYDVFMTFLTPMILNKSVMMAVATAGNDERIAVIDGVCHRTLAEHLPMLFLVPHQLTIFSFTETYSPRNMNNFSMLGLGDVFLPALVFVYCLRVDFFKMRALQFDKQMPLSLEGIRAGYSYFRSCLLGYAIGLFLTLLANYNGFTLFSVKGQPALLYLVPCMLTCITFTARTSREFSFLWASSLDKLEVDLPRMTVFKKWRSPEEEPLVSVQAMEQPDEADL